LKTQFWQETKVGAALVNYESTMPQVLLVLLPPVLLYIDVGIEEVYFIVIFSKL
jgi:hypothetical protein